MMTNNLLTIGCNIHNRLFGAILTQVIKFRLLYRVPLCIIYPKLCGVPEPKLPLDAPPKFPQILIPVAASRTLGAVKPHFEVLDITTLFLLLSHNGAHPPGAAGHTGYFYHVEKHNRAIVHYDVTFLGGVRILVRLL
jgi:hypothetical protein